MCIWINKAPHGHFVSSSRMRVIVLSLMMLLLSDNLIFAQFDINPPVTESGYGMVRTNITAGYDHTFGAVPDCLSGKVTYEIVKKPYLTFSANARFNTLWANFADTQLSESYDAWGIGLNGNHTYGSFGFTALGFLPLFGKPLAILAIGNAEWSNHCFGRISGLAGAVYIFKMTKDTQIGVGPVLIIHTSSKIPVFPGIVLRHKFNDKLALNIYGGLFAMEWKPTANDMFSCGADLDTRSFYFKPGVEGWPDKCRFTMTLFRPNFKYKRRLARNFYGEVQTGVAFKMSGRVTSATRSKSYLNFHESPSFVLKAAISWSL